ncbi:hypothetical protein [Bacillus sonorensis]|uniref:hypothetical protein n=1 Tax=Bacillus sonorensis TaxID=119858 RepID=UPI000E51E30F|nr:hypothetical protein [Bacillus sonorensis]RHJ05870.1 hypothetical protein DW143_21220 [Bacillus sonorensis]GIN67630.1 hypothetical protein J41TS2_30510 [Bacillus sonorensis]
MFNLIERVTKSDWYTLITSIIKLLSLTTFLLTSFSLFFWGIGYAFLYGYYFGGEITETPSILEMLIRIVPFNFNSVMIISTFVICSVFCLFYIGILVKEKKIKNIILSVLIFIGLHIILTTIFIGELSLLNLVYFSALWIIPLFIITLAFYFYRAVKFLKVFSIISGVLTGFILGVLLIKFIQDESLSYLLGVFICFSLGIAYSYLPIHNIFSRFILSFPWSLIASGVIKVILSDFLYDNFIIRLAFIILLSFILSFIYSFYLYPKLWWTNNNSNTAINNDQNNHKIKKMFELLISSPKPMSIIIVVLVTTAFLLFTPMFSYYSGKVIRVATPPNTFKYEIIETGSLSSKKVEGILVSEQNNILYISSKNDFRLIRVKDESFKTEESRSK